jgi:dihydrodipicolinate synthase/N-acetylneuraminate lyase
MAVCNPPRGLIIDLITPLDESGRINGRGLGRLLDGVLPHVHGVLLAGPNMGEGRGLNASLREELLDKALVVVRGHVPLFCWITGTDENETLETLVLLKKRLQKRKYTGLVFWVDTPLFYHSNRGLPDYYGNAPFSSENPLVLHNDPGFIKRLDHPFKRSNIRTSILKVMAVGNEGVGGLIYLGTLDRAQNYQRAVRSRIHFRIYDGDESRFLDYPSMGGVLSAGANLSPQAWYKITNSSLHMHGEKAYPDQMRQLWETGKKLRSMIEVYRHLPVRTIKGILAERGIIETAACTPITREEEGDTARLKEAMNLIGDVPS